MALIESKTLRKTLIATLVLLFIIVVGGMIYVLISDRNNKPVIANRQENTQQPSPIKPIPPSANSPEGVAIESLISPVVAGSNSSISINTNAGSNCDISVAYNGIKSTDSGLVAKMADAYGNVTWAWTVGDTVPVGNWPIQVTCFYHGRSGVVDGSLQVIK